MRPRAAWRLEDNPGGLALHTAMLHRHLPVPPRKRCWRGRGVARLERHLEIDETALRCALGEADPERMCALRPSALPMHDLRKRPEIERVLAKVRVPAPVGGIPHRPHRREERGLAGAVLTDEERERRQGHGLPLAEAAELP